MTLTSGTKLDPYEIESIPGGWRHGWAVSRAARRLNGTVAIQVLPQSFSADANWLPCSVRRARVDFTKSSQHLVD